jgi:hypothetical protein
MALLPSTEATNQHTWSTHWRVLREVIRTFELAGNLEKLLVARIHCIVGTMDRYMLLAELEQHIARHVGHSFAARERECVALDLEDGTAVDRLDAKAVAGKRHNFFL